VSIRIFFMGQMDTYVALWFAFLGVWIIAAASTKRNVRRDSSTLRFVYGVLVPFGAFLVIQPSRLGPLEVPLLPHNRVVEFCGLTITAAGMGFAIWARFTLGRNWSGTVTVKAGHELIRSGPYRFVRHPIYSGILAGLLGTAIGQATLPSLIGVVIALYGLRMKWKTEERFMVEQFGALNVQYQGEVKAVIPGLL
jgi:protein-S-isoprenylcysteine O-methyltransferase Ste14